MPSLTTPFEVTEDGEPHRIRRKEMLQRYPEIRKMYGFDRRTATVTIMVVVLQLALAWTHGRAAAAGTLWGHPGMVLLNAFVVGAILSHWLGQTIHETSHNLAFRRPIHNRMLAWFANLPMLLPIAATFRRYHVEHHTFLGVEGRDSDFPHPAEVSLVDNSGMAKFTWLFFYMFVYVARGVTFARSVSAAEVANAVVQVGFGLLVHATMGWTGLAYLALSTVIGHSLHPVAAHFIHEHYVFEEGQETNSYYGALNLVTFNVGYHVEHHDFMNIPGWRLPELHALAPEYYQPLASHTSWTWVLFRFVTDRTMSVGSRIVRSRESFRGSRKRLAPGDGVRTGRGLLAPEVGDRTALVHVEPPALPAWASQECACRITSSIAA